MKKTMLTVAALSVFAAFAAPASALTVTNNDEGGYTVAVSVGEQNSEISVDTGASVEAPCGDGCLVSLIGNDGVIDEVEAVDADHLTITAGVFQKAE